jgi:hypothetical protein
MKNMSLHVEYGFYTFYFYDNNHRIVVYEYLSDPDRLEDRKIESDGWEFDESNVLFGLSFIFNLDEINLKYLSTYRYSIFP